MAEQTPKGDKPEKKPKAEGAEGGAPKGEKKSKEKAAPKIHVDPPAESEEAKAEKKAKAEKAAAAVEAAAAAPAPAEGAKHEKHPKGEKHEGAKGEKAEKHEKAAKGEKPAKGEKKKGDEGEGAPAEGGKKKSDEKLPPPPPPRFWDKYRNEIRPKLKTSFGYKNDIAVPKLSKIVISMGVGAALQNPKRLEEAQKHLTQIAGQKAVTTKARVSIANFRLREGQGIGCKVTLRRARMYEFLDRLVSVAIPRIRDFRGMSPKGFDGRGNYSMGLTEQVVFPEVDADRMEFTQGMNIAICTTAKSDKEAHELLSSFGFPFRQ
jgi:large subunit ribosomal protein L5